MSHQVMLECGGDIVQVGLKQFESLEVKDYFFFLFVFMKFREFWIFFCGVDIFHLIFWCMRFSC